MSLVLYFAFLVFLAYLLGGAMALWIMGGLIMAGLTCIIWAEIKS